MCEYTVVYAHAQNEITKIFTPEHCRIVQTMEQPEVSSSSAQQNTLVQTSEQRRAFCIPAAANISNQYNSIENE